MSILHSNPIEIDIPGRNPNGQFPMRQTRALPACLTAKTLKRPLAISL
jgi:hypothetical protein